MSEPQEVPWNPNEQNGLDREVYRFLVTQYLYEDQLSWSRVQTLVAVEAGLLAAAFAKRGLVAILALVVGSLLIALIWRLIERGWEVRDQNLKILDQVHKPRQIRMVKTARGVFWRGSCIIRLTVGLIIFANLALALLFAWCRNTTPEKTACDPCAIVAESEQREERHSGPSIALRPGMSLGRTARG